MEDGEPRRSLWSLSQSTLEKRPVIGTYRYLLIPPPAGTARHCSFWKTTIASWAPVGSQL